MFKLFSAAILAVATLCAASFEANAQPSQIYNAPCDAACMARKGWTPVRAADNPRRTDWICNGVKQQDGTCTPSGNTNQQAANVPQADVGSTSGVRTLSPSELANLAVTVAPEDLGKKPAATLTSAPAPQATPVVPNQPFRVFTPNVKIEDLAGAFKDGAESNVLNAPTEDVRSAFSTFSNLRITSQVLFGGRLIDCQKAGVEGKSRIGVKVKQNMTGLKEFSFVSVGPAFTDCQPGQKLYVVNDGNGSYVAIADNSGYLLGTAPAASGITISR